MAYTNNAYLFVDWEFVWNDHVHYIKNVIDNHRLGSLRSISMNRLNMGPIRHDTNARQDLAAHDISILYTLFSSRLSNGQWVLYRRNSNSIEPDSCIGYFKHSGATIQINASWHYG
jgi:predicted dehydrogenase